MNCGRLRKIFQFYPWRKPSTAPYRVSIGEEFTIVHPFHPLSGKKFELINFTDCWSRKRAFYIDDNNNLSSVPVEWTDVLSPDPFIHISDGRSSLHAFALLELAELINILKKKV